MNIYLRAAVKTAVMIFTSVLIIGAVGLGFEYIPIEYLKYIGLFLLVASFVYLAYTINLGQLQYQEKLEDLNKSFKSLKVDK